MFFPSTGPEKDLNGCVVWLKIFINFTNLKRRKSHVVRRKTKNWKSLSLWRLKSASANLQTTLRSDFHVIICKFLVFSLTPFNKSVTLLIPRPSKVKKSSIQFMIVITVHFEYFQIHWGYDSVCPTLNCAVTVS